MRLLAALLFTLSAHAAVIQGVVLDEETGNPLARTLVTLTPLPGTQAGAVTLHTGERGAFSILSVRTGWYILKTSRRGFADTEAGQLRPGRAGLPFEVTPDTQSTFLQIRMRRLAAAAGAVVDDNGVGIPDWPVHLYTSRKPVRRIAEGKTDDRGNFRIGSLDPGSYVIRSGAGVLDDNTPLLATYYKYGTALQTSEAFRLRLGETQPDLIVRPVRGKLLSISGILGPPYIPDTPVQLTLITDTGRRLIASGPGPFEATGIPPGPLELVVEGYRCGSYTRMVADRDLSGLRPGCLRLDPMSIDWRSQESPRTLRGYPILGRRADLDGTGPVRLLKPNEPVPPGHWELMVEPSADYYTTSLRSQLGGEPTGRDGLYGGWYGLYLGNQARLQITLSNRPATLAGVVSSGGKRVAGAAVYVELFNPDLPEKRLQLWELRTDAQGNYSLPGLAPGRYRAVSSFDFDPEDPLAMEKGAEVVLKEGDTVTKALEMLLP
jgi:hypothetical protein